MATTTGQAGGQLQQLTGVPTQYATDAQELARSQRLAELLSAGKPAEGQMVSGRFVAPSWTQHLNQLAQAGLGAYYGNKAETQQMELAKKLREGESAAMADYMAQLKGREGTPDKVTEMAGPYGKGVGQAGANVPMPTATMAGRAAVPADPFLANMNAARNEMLPSFIREHAMKEITKGPKWEKAEYTDEKTGKTRQGVIDVNSANPISTFQVGGVKPEMSAYERASLNMRGAELSDQGIGGYGGGQPQGQPMVQRVGAPVGQPMGQPMNQPQGVPQGQPAGQPAFAPSTLPAYQNDPSLSPRQNREQALKFSEKQQSNVTNAKDSFDLMKAAGSLLSSNAPSSGALSNFATYVGEAANLPYGARKQESEADAQLKMLSGALTMKQPRFEGPQGVLDVTLYQKLAGDLGNANIPVESRLATMKQMVNLQKKYYPSGDWDSIDTQLKDTGKVSLGPKKEVDFNSLPTGRR
jgi:hypothetical protein